MGTMRAAWLPAAVAGVLAVLTAAASTPAGAAAAKGHASQLTVPAPLNVTETWSTALDDNDSPIAFSSPIPADLDGQESVVVGDREGYVYAFHLGNPVGNAPTSVAGWPTTDGSGPIDSTPSIDSTGSQESVLVGSGNDADPTTGGYQAYGPAGNRLWYTPATNPAPDIGVQAGITVGALQSGNDAVAGSLGQVTYALNAQTGATLTGWPFLNTDSTHSTAALADLYGTNQNEIIVGSDQTGGLGAGQSYTNGGHLRILTAQGNEICRADTDQVVDSSPAVGGFLAGGATGIVVGTGSFFPGAPDTDTLKAYNTLCQLQWSDTLDGSTYSSPALSDVLGNGSLQVVEGTDQGTGASGSVWVLNAATGQTIWKATNIGRVIGSVVTADLTGLGYDDVIVPTVNGALVFDGQTGVEVADLSPNLGLQNSPLVTADPNGTIGITLAGYAGTNDVGVIDHYEITGSNGPAAIGPGSWPMFHHDPQLTGNAGGTTPVGSIPACSVPAAAYTGYVLAASDGGVFTFGGAPFCGSTGGMQLNAPIVGIAQAPASGGYWEVASDGGIFAFGGAGFYGSMGGIPLTKPVVGMTSDTQGNGYRLVASDGGIFSFGAAPFFGSMGGQHLNRPVIGMVNDTNSGGYWEVASDGGIFSFGGAPFLGSTGAIPLNAPIVGMAETSNGSGYRMVASDGGVFSFIAPFLGSMGGTLLNAPVVGISGF